MKKIISAKVKAKALWKTYLNKLTEKMRQYPTKYVIIQSLDGDKITVINTDSESFGIAYLSEYSGNYNETLANAYKNLLDQSNYIDRETVKILKNAFFNLYY